MQGYRGTPVGGAVIELLGHTSGKPDQLLARLVADRAGLVMFARRPAETMRFTVRTPATSTYGGSVSPSVVVNVRLPAAVRISLSATTVRRGESVLIGIRAVNARTGAGIAAATIELWQLVSGKPWQRSGRYTASNTGLMQTRRWPNVTVTYQGRLVASNIYQSASSRTAVVRVT